jgi:hypothetical protein
MAKSQLGELKIALSGRLARGIDFLAAAPLHRTPSSLARNCNVWRKDFRLPAFADAQPAPGQSIRGLAGLRQGPVSLEPGGEEWKKRVCGRRESRGAGGRGRDPGETEIRRPGQTNAERNFLIKQSPQNLPLMSSDDTIRVWPHYISRHLCTWGYFFPKKYKVFPKIKTRREIKKSLSLAAESVGPKAETKLGR